MQDNLELYGDENFSSFEGDLDIYTGEGDDFLDFAGGHSFAEEQHTGRIFVMSITNETASAQKVALTKAFATKAGNGLLIAKDGTIFTDPKGGTKVTAKGTPTNIVDLQEFLKIAPSNLAGVRIQSTDPSQMHQVMSVQEYSPFRKMESKEIFLGTYVSESNFKDNLITVPTPDVVLGAETELSLTVVPKSTLTITLFVGAVLSQSSALSKKVKRARKHISLVGLPYVKKMNQMRLTK